MTEDEFYSEYAKLCKKINMPPFSTETDILNNEAEAQRLKVAISTYNADYIKYLRFREVFNILEKFQDSFSGYRRL
jgi:hypothetical protein